MGGIRYTHKSYVTKVTDLFPDYKILSKFIRSNEPISYRCNRGHINKSRADSLLRGHGCKDCMHEALATIHRLKPFEFELRSEKIQPGKIYVVPPPYNNYKAEYIGKGKWKLFSSRGQINPTVGPTGHLYVGLSNNNKARGFSLHQIVFAVKKGNWKFLKLIEKGFEIDHKDRNPGNNRPKNLRLATKAKQQRNSDRTFVHNFAILKWIYMQRAEGRKYKDVANELGCHYSTISDAINGRTHQELIPKLSKSLVLQARSFS